MRAVHHKGGPVAELAPYLALRRVLVKLVQRLEPHPTLVKGRRWDVLAANPAARELFGDWSGGGERNLVRWMFTSDRAKMGAFANPPWVKILAWLTAGIIVLLNVKYLFDKLLEWLG